MGLLYYGRVFLSMGPKADFRFRQDMEGAEERVYMLKLKTTKGGRERERERKGRIRR
jgi:hypothetical protein